METPSSRPRAAASAPESIATSSARRQAEPPIRLRTAADIVVAVPYLLGFRPSDSLVLLVLGGHPVQVNLSVRVDLPAEDWSERDLERFLAPLRVAASRAEGTSVHLLVYPDDFDDPTIHGMALPRLALVEAACSAFAEDGRAVREVSCVVPSGSGGYRYWSYFCADPHCCPVEGRIVDGQDAGEVRFAFVSAGRAPLASRAELVRSLDPADSADPAVPALAASCETAHLELDRALSSRDGLPGWRRRTVRMLDAALGDPDRTGRALPVELQGLLAVALTVDVQLRDVLLGAAVREHRLPAFTDVLAPLVRQLPDELVAGSAATAAAVAYLDGHGALAWAAVDRALAADPQQSLAELMASVMSAGLPPYGLADFVRSLPAPADWDGSTLIRSDRPRGG